MHYDSVRGCNVKRSIQGFLITECKESAVVVVEVYERGWSEEPTYYISCDGISIERKANEFIEAVEATWEVIDKEGGWNYLKAYISSERDLPPLGKGQGDEKKYKGRIKARIYSDSSNIAGYLKMYSENGYITSACHVATIIADNKSCNLYVMKIYDEKKGKCIGHNLYCEHFRIPEPLDVGVEEIEKIYRLYGDIGVIEALKDIAEKSR